MASDDSVWAVITSLVHRYPRWLGLLHGLAAGAVLLMAFHWFGFHL